MEQKNCVRRKISRSTKEEEAESIRHGYGTSTAKVRLSNRKLLYQKGIVPVKYKGDITSDQCMYNKPGRTLQTLKTISLLDWQGCYDIT